MLILVAVTVNIANDKGGLFEKTREAKRDTAYKAEEENLATYMYGKDIYDATKGEVNLDNLKTSLDNSGEWGTATIAGTKLTVIGKQSGEEHIVNSDGTIGEKKESEIVGKKFYATGENIEYGDYMQFNSDFSGEYIVYDRDNPTQVGELDSTTFKYTYDAVTKKGQIITHYEEDGESWDQTMDFDYVSIKDEGGNEVNQAIVIEGSLKCHFYATNKNEGLMPLGNNVYASGDKTIEFGITNKNGVTYGIYTIKENGSIISTRGEGYYTCYNQIIDGIHGLGEVSINADHSAITLVENGTVYTKQ